MINDKIIKRAVENWQTIVSFVLHTQPNEKSANVSTRKRKRKENQWMNHNKNRIYGDFNWFVKGRWKWIEAFCEITSKSHFSIEPLRSRKLVSKRWGRGSRYWDEKISQHSVKECGQCCITSHPINLMNPINAAKEKNDQTLWKLMHSLCTESGCCTRQFCGNDRGFIMHITNNYEQVSTEQVL